MTFLLISFIAGVLTVLAPCILPVLPVIIGGSISGGENRRKANTIILSLVVSVVFFTLILKWSTAFVMVPPVVWNIISGVILVAFALTMIFPGLWEKLPFVSKLSIGSNKLLGTGYQKKSLWGDIIIGAALGPVFSSCSPTYFVILATILPKSFATGLLYLITYAVGLGVALLAISLLGQKLVDRLELLADPRGLFKRSIGVLFLIVGIFVLIGADKKVQSFVLTHVFDVTKIEQLLLRKGDTSTSIGESRGLTVEEKQARFMKYAEIAQPGGYVNTGDVPFTIGQYVGKKVVLLDFVTYSCINCQRTFPYLNTWYDKYEDDGLIIIGIHTPEFAFEHDKENVTKAMKEFGIRFPILLDNDYGTWQAYGNSYWPRKYLIDIDGYVVYDHIGEGGYGETEEKIVELLNERARKLGEEPVAVEEGEVKADKPSLFVSRETYLGDARVEYQKNTDAVCMEGVCVYGKEALTPLNNFSLTGTWKRDQEYVELATAPGSIFYTFNAKKVYLVAESKNGSMSEIYLDGKLISAEDAGAEVKDGRVIFLDSKLYNLASFDGVETHTLEIRIKDAGFRGYAFTFG